MKTKYCPECGNVLSNPQSCKCGWGGKFDENQVYDPVCVAHGCPLPAAHVRERFAAGRRAGAPKNGVCRFHDYAQNQHWQEVTRRIRVNSKLVDACARLNRLSLVEIKAIPIREFAGIPETKPLEGEDSFQWAHRIYGILDRRIKAELEAATTKSGIDVESEYQAKLQQAARSVLVD